MKTKRYIRNCNLNACRNGSDVPKVCVDIVVSDGKTVTKVFPSDLSMYMLCCFRKQKERIPRMKLACTQACTAALNVDAGFGHGLSVVFTQMEVLKTEPVLSQNHRFWLCSCTIAVSKVLALVYYEAASRSFPSYRGHVVTLFSTRLLAGMQGK